MINIEIPVIGEQLSKRELVGAKLKQWVVLEKMYNPFGFIVFTLLSGIFAYLISSKGLPLGVLIIGGLVGPVIFAALAINPQFALVFYLTLSNTIMFLLLSGVNFPLGTVLDGILLILVINFYVQQKKKKRWDLVSGPMSKAILAWILYNIFEVINPAADSRLAWVYTIRTCGVVAISYFMFIYNVRTKAFMKTLISLWMFFCVFAAWYAFKQEYIGFSQNEEAYLHSSSQIEGLLFISGHWRKFSIYSDPVTFAYNMVAGAIFCIGCLTGPTTPRKRFWLIFLIFSCLYNMIFSGTRGAFPLLPVGLILYAIIKFSRKIMIFTIIAALFIVGLIFVPTTNQNIVRFQSAFRPNEDNSYKVRKFNQARIKPYIWSHPIGGGLGSTGEWGKKFAPGSYLSGFPPDSGYVRTTVEAGPIGLLIFVLMIFTILKTGINNYYNIKDPELKAICLGATLVVFVFNVGNFPQEALVQYPSNIHFYLSSALIIVTRRIDDQQNQLIHEQNI